MEVWCLVNLSCSSEIVGIILEEKNKYKKLYRVIWFFTLLNIIFPGDLSPAELMMLTIGDVIKQLIEAHEQGKDIDLNK